MALLSSHICKFGWRAVPFMLLGTDGNIHASHRCGGENGTVVVFMCNHCPYVLRALDRLCDDAQTLKNHGINVIAINANDAEQYPEDSFENMQVMAQKHNFSFPYLVDSSQEVAYAYGALCTPDFFGFNNKWELHYRGRLDSAGSQETNTPNPSAREGRELVDAMVAIGKTGKGPQQQTASMGCSIKWRDDSLYVKNGYAFPTDSASN